MFDKQQQPGHLAKVLSLRSTKYTVVVVCKTSVTRVGCDTTNSKQTYPLPRRGKRGLLG